MDLVYCLRIQPKRGQTKPGFIGIRIPRSDLSLCLVISTGTAGCREEWRNLYNLRSNSNAVTSFTLTRVNSA
jgi:hypothetical protein